MSSKIALDSPGTRVLLSGNEAIARGAVESGVQVVASYPGTPTAEILENIASVAKQFGIHAEWSVNEKVAFEVAAGASYCGVRSITSMKHVGVNVASDTLMTLNYTGVKGGFVLVSGDDPYCHSSQNEQDNRFYARFAKIFCLEPSSPQEAKDMIIEAFEISEKLALPVMLRTVTRTSHAKSDVILGELPKEKRKAEFVKDPKNFVCMPINSRPMHKRLNQKLIEMQKLSENSKFNHVKLDGDEKVGIIASGVSWNYVLDALEILKPKEKVALLKIGIAHPLPDLLIKKILNSVELVLIVEELEPFVEEHVKGLLSETNPKVKILGKYSNDIPREGELSFKKILPGVTGLFRIDFKINENLTRQAGEILPPRPAILCPGCPHMGTFYAIKEAAPNGIYPSDIGCYGLGFNPPLKTVDTMLCMGSGEGIGQGIYQVGEGHPVIVTIGDSTFLHAGMPALLNSVYNKAKLTVVIMDNRITAMTGHQPHPAVGITATGEKTKSVKLEEIARALGVDFVEVTDPFNIKSTTEIIKKAVEYPGTSVVISRRMCSLLARRLGVKMKPYRVDPEICTFCLTCINGLGCPALAPNAEASKMEIDLSLCWGCSCCAQVCPYNAISEVS
ncbi:MAG: indolepyruvate ferredoxin oxidoreductase subunit alpha [Euryarchaeota archaeon]|nr:indolepyruvate ferredoxin oxidoreductase subunit alpha [Euryarchaeota archaeon]